MIFIVFIESIGFVGLGLIDWLYVVDVFVGCVFYVVVCIELLLFVGLLFVEWCCMGFVVCVVFVVGYVVVVVSGCDVVMFVIVFSVFGGDGQNCYVICEMLVGDDCQLLLICFYNLVYNVLVGYWSIVICVMVMLNVLCVYDGSFVVGLFESLCQVVVDCVLSLLIVYDIDYLELLCVVWLIGDVFGVVFVFVLEVSECMFVCIDVQFIDVFVMMFVYVEFDVLCVGNLVVCVLLLLDVFVMW